MGMEEGLVLLLLLLGLGWEGCGGVGGHVEVAGEGCVGGAEEGLVRGVCWVGGLGGGGLVMLLVMLAVLLIQVLLVRRGVGCVGGVGGVLL